MLNGSPSDQILRDNTFAKNMYNSMMNDLSWSNMKNFEMVYFPVFMESDYFIVVFNLKNPAIHALDHLAQSLILGDGGDNEIYEQKDPAYKLV